MSEEPIRVAVVEREHELRGALADLIAAEPGLRLIAAAADPRAARRLAVEQHPDVMLLDVRAPGGGTMETIRAIQRDSPTTAVLVLPAEVRQRPAEAVPAQLTLVALRRRAGRRSQLPRQGPRGGALPTGPGQQPSLLAGLVWALERERARIAAGIHDDTLQVITAATLRLQQLRRRLHDPADLAVLDRLEETVALASHRLRRLIFEFRPPALEREGLAAALRDYLVQVSDESGLEPHIDDRTGGEPPQQVRMTIYRIAQEALANAGRHSRATRIDISLSEVDNGYLVEIVDDGAGLPQPEPEPEPGHLGLVLMRERAELAGGWCRVDSAPGQGTTVTFWVPRDGGGQPPAARPEGSR